MPIDQRSATDGTILRQLRQQQGLRVNELARRANVSSATITLLEQGARRASPALLNRLSAALHVEPSALSDIAASALKTNQTYRNHQPFSENPPLSAEAQAIRSASPRWRGSSQQTRPARGGQRYGPPVLGDLADEIAQVIATESNPKRAEHRATMRVLRRLCAHLDSPHVATIAHVARCWPRDEDNGIITRLQITETFGRDAPVHYAIGFRLGASTLCGQALHARMTMSKRGLAAEPEETMLQEFPDILPMDRELDQRRPFIPFGNHRSGLASPIIKFGTRVAGVLLVTSPQPDYFRYEDPPALEAYARLLTLCMQNFYDWSTVHLASDVAVQEPDVPPLSLRHDD
jgi:transcriptional regulator with XRE-family HTH domain